MPLPLLILLILGFDVLVMAPLTAWLAGQRDRSPLAWFAVGVVAGPLALLAVGLAPPAGLEPVRPRHVMATQVAAPPEWPDGPRSGDDSAGPAADGQPSAGSRPPRVWAAVPWSRLDVPAAASPEEAHLQRTITALGAPTALLLGAIGAPAAEGTSGVETVSGLEEVVAPEDTREADDAPEAHEIDEDRPLRLRQMGRRRRTPASSTAQDRSDSETSTQAPTPGQRSTARGSTAKSAAAKSAAARSSTAKTSTAKSSTTTSRTTTSAAAKGSRSRSTQPPIRLVPPWQAEADEPPRVPSRAPHLEAVAAHAPADEEVATSSICVAVFLGGMPELAIGERYVIEVDAAAISIAEAVTVTRRPFRIRFPLPGAGLVEFEDRFVISCWPTPARQVHLGFRGAPSTRVRRRLIAAQQASEEGLNLQAGQPGSPPQGRSSSAGR